LRVRGRPGRGPLQGHGIFIKRDGTRAFEKTFAKIGYFSNGLACVAELRGGPWGFIDKTGDFAIEPRFERASDFSNGLAAVRYWIESEGRRETAVGYIDTEGHLAFPVAGMTRASDFRNGLALVVTRNGAGYLNTKGEWVWKTGKEWQPLGR